jgi:hypothetical protein
MNYFNSLAAALLGLALCIPASAKDHDLAAELSKKNDGNAACKIWYTADLSHLTIHGYDFTMKWLDKEAVKNYPSLCFTLDKTKAQFTLAITTSPLATTQGVGTRTQLQTSNSTTNLNGSVSGDVNGTANSGASNTTYNGTYNGNYSGTANTTTTTAVQVPYTYTVNTQMIYGYTNGNACGSVYWSFNTGTGLVGGMVQKGSNNHHIRELFEHCFDSMLR